MSYKPLLTIRVIYADDTGYATWINADNTQEAFEYLAQAPHITENFETGKETRKHVKLVQDITNAQTYEGFVNVETWYACLEFSNHQPLYNDLMRHNQITAFKAQKLFELYFPQRKISDYYMVFTNWFEVAEELNIRLQEK